MMDEHDPWNDWAWITNIISLRRFICEWKDRSDGWQRSGLGMSHGEVNEHGNGNKNTDYLTNSDSAASNIPITNNNHEVVGGVDQEHEIQKTAIN